MSQIRENALAADATHAERFGDKAQLSMPPSKQFAVLSCLDAGLDPTKYAVLAEGAAHVIANAGGRPSDNVIRSLVISYKLLSTQQ